MYNFIVCLFHFHKPFFKFYFSRGFLITFFSLICRHLTSFLLLEASIFPVSLLEIMPHCTCLIQEYYSWNINIVNFNRGKTHAKQVWIFLWFWIQAVAHNTSSGLMTALGAEPRSSGLSSSCKWYFRYVLILIYLVKKLNHFLCVCLLCVFRGSFSILGFWPLINHPFQCFPYPLWNPRDCLSRAQEVAVVNVLWTGPDL